MTGTNPYSWTLTDPRGGIILNKWRLNKCYNWHWRLLLNPKQPRNTRTASIAQSASITTDDRKRKHGHTYLEQRRRGDTECSIVHWQYRTLLYPSRDARASTCARDTNWEAVTAAGATCGEVKVHRSLTSAAFENWVRSLAPMNEIGGWS